MTRPLNTKFTISEDRPTLVYYDIKVALTLLLPSGTISLRIYDGSNNETILASHSFSYLAGLGNWYTQLSGFVPANYEVQLVTSGSGTVTVEREQEVVG